MWSVENHWQPLGYCGFTPLAKSCDSPAQLCDPLTKLCDPLAKLCDPLETIKPIRFLGFPGATKNMISVARHRVPAIRMVCPPGQSAETLCF